MLQGEKQRDAAHLHLQPGACGVGCLDEVTPGGTEHLKYMEMGSGMGEDSLWVAQSSALRQGNAAGVQSAASAPLLLAGPIGISITSNSSFGK